MLRLLFLLPAGVSGAAHAGCPTGRANANAQGTCPSGYELDLQGTNAPVVEEPTTTAAPVVTEAPVTEAPATEPPATEPPATQPPATQPPATEAPDANATNGTNGTNSTRMLSEDDEFFFKPIRRSMSVHSLCACAMIEETVPVNVSNETIPTASVEVETKMTIVLDISGMSDVQKTATGNSLAFGLHAASCRGVSSMWTTLVQCMMGQSSEEGVNFGVDMAIDAALGTAEYGCNDETDCYGGDAPTRRMEATTLENSAVFTVTAEGNSAASLAQTAKTALDTAQASGDTFSADAILAEVQRAMSRPAMNATLGAYVALLEEAVAAAVVEVAVAEIEGATVAPSGGSTSNAFMMGVSTVFMLIAGALLM